MEYDRATGSPVDVRLTTLIADTDEVAVTDPVTMEVLAGARDDRREQDLRRLLDRFRLVRFDPVVHFPGAVRIYRSCRRAGVTPRGLVDCMIAAVASDTGTPVLAHDRDFARIAEVVDLPSTGTLCGRDSALVRPRRLVGESDVRAVGEDALARSPHNLAGRQVPTSVSLLEGSPVNPTDTDRSEQQREALANRLVGDFSAAMETLGVWLGLYAALDRLGKGTSGELASAAGIDARYAREWCEQQAVAGVLVTGDAERDADERRYHLPAPHREVLLDEVSPYFVAPVTYALAGIARVLPELLAAYRAGTGVPFSAYGDEIRDHIEQLNRPMFVNDLASSWLPAVPDLHARLQADPPARVADIACGAGWASIALAQAYPKVRVDGFDLDETSIRRATRNAAAAGIDDRVSFAVRDADDPALAGRYEAAVMFEALHDLARPVEALAAARALLADGGCVIVGDERAAETFTAPGDEVERLLYGFSILHCLPASRTETPSAATGTVLRPDTLRSYAREAGFSDVQVLNVDNEMWRFYHLSG